ncbi:hypothetical protein EDC01DRAFT_156031 [Geopyxis carbonaria]|nr:hypothetical protein EDC01DRAFT_156031 [Geopyxis carbonaria]
MSSVRVCPWLHGPQNVWSYTIPILSLAHPPLLHAILALSSLHISKLTKGPSHPSLLHYHIALRRLGKAIASDRHRAHVATLAATLMLAYYETMAAEHDKWSSHIHGAKQLLKEVDFDRVTKRVELLDEDEQLAAQNGGQGESQSPFAAPQQPSGASLLAMRKMRRQMISDDVDESLKSYLMGTKGRRGASGKGKKKESNAERPFSKKELEHLKLQADMFWWYAKMDCYQSLLSGCSLILDYVHWGQCPPRARIGTLGTTYGSSDHYFLLLGRLCDFQVRDLRRKRAVMKANGGQWIPPPEMGGPPRGHRRPPPPNGMPPQEPMQFGMIPPAAHPPRIPRAFAETGIHEEASQNMDGPLPDDEDLDAATADAELEWAEIEKAFMVLQESLGAEYQPLPIEYMPVHSTPFGPAIYYRTYSIASLQMLYNMAMLVLHRCHPSMPPVAMMATGIQTRVTAPFAVDIARIVAGLVPTDSSTQINPALGASLIEATMPMFFAAVQYAEPEQRDWTVKKLREINRLTGWATASRILLGCQRAWEKAAEMGRAPPYTRPPFEEEAELFNEYYNYHQAVRNEPKEAEAGGDGARFLWKMAGRRTVEASGILGERDDVDLGIGMGMGMGMM